MKYQTNLSTQSALVASFSFLLPLLSNAADYSSNGAILLGSEVEEHTSNIVAALIGANFSFTCLIIVILQLASIYIFHRIWHPRRIHEEMSEQERRQGTFHFFAGGTAAWMMISVMAESWCTILPLAIFLLILFAWYAASFLREDN